MKKTLKGFLHFSTDPWNYGELAFYCCDMSKSGNMGCLLIKPMEIEVDIPDDFDPKPAQIAALKAKQTKAAADFHAMNVEFMRQINELQALEML